jgi:Matrixin
MSFRIILIALVSLCCACSPLKCPKTPKAAIVYTNNSSPGPEITETSQKVWVDKRFSSEHRAAIHDAFAEWNRALNGYQRFDIVSDDFDMDMSVLTEIEQTDQGIIVLSRSLTDPEVMQLGDGVLAWVSELGGHDVNIIEQRMGTRDFKIITLHEMGHILGLSHVDVRHSMMFAYYPQQPPCLDKVTMLRIATNWKYDINHLNYCNIL